MRPVLRVLILTASGGEGTGRMGRMTISETLPVIAIVGPTGTGKSALAIELALRLNGECINADSMQFYRGMDIGTAKVTAEETRGVPHHLLDIMDVRDDASVAEFQERSRELIEQIRGRGRYPILVGGSGLYVRAALDKLEFPGTDARVRERLEEQARAEGIGVLHARLAEVDPESAARVKDERRIIRALEVFEVTGRPFSAFMPVREYVTESIQIGLDMDRALLHERLHRRVELMHEQGLLDEIRTLNEQGLQEGKTASRAIGYAQFARALENEDYSVEQAIEDTTIATRQFARRQLTWFRADPRVHWLDALSPTLADEALATILQK